MRRTHVGVFCLPIPVSSLKLGFVFQRFHRTPPTGLEKGMI